MRETSFRMGPFACPHCGHSLLVDAIHKVESDNPVSNVSNLPPNYLPSKVFDMSIEDPDWYRQFNDMGRYQLINELLHLRQETKRLREKLAPPKTLRQRMFKW